MLVLSRSLLKSHLRAWSSYSTSTVIWISIILKSHDGLARRLTILIVCTTNLTLIIRISKEKESKWQATSVLINFRGRFSSERNVQIDPLRTSIFRVSVVIVHQSLAEKLLPFVKNDSVDVNKYFPWNRLNSSMTRSLYHYRWHETTLSSNGSTSITVSAINTVDNDWRFRYIISNGASLPKSSPSSSTWWNWSQSMYQVRQRDDAFVSNVLAFSVRYLMFGFNILFWVGILLLLWVKKSSLSSARFLASWSLQSASTPGLRKTPSITLAAWRWAEHSSSIQPYCSFSWASSCSSLASRAASVPWERTPVYFYS